jgi:hypothetical protein
VTIAANLPRLRGFCGVDDEDFMAGRGIVKVVVIVDGSGGPLVGPISGPIRAYEVKERFSGRVRGVAYLEGRLGSVGLPGEMLADQCIRLSVFGRVVVSHFIAKSDLNFSGPLARIAFHHPTQIDLIIFRVHMTSSRVRRCWREMCTMQLGLLGF